MKAIVISNAAAQIVWASEPVYLLVGEPQGSLVGADFVDFFEQRTDIEFSKVMEEAFDGKRDISVEAKFDSKRTKPVELEFVISAVEDPVSGDLLAYVSISVREPEKFVLLPVDATSILQANAADPFKEAYHLTSLSFADAQELFRRTEHLMEENKSFRKPTFDLSAAAKLLRSNTTYISHVINFFAGCSFTHYINHKRLGYFLQHHPVGQYATLDKQVILDSGFGSYHAFYRFVKKVYGYTPTKLIRSMATALEDVEAAE